MHFESFLRTSGIPLVVKRNGQSLRTETGLMNHEQATGKAYVGFVPGTDVISGDTLTNSAGEILYVTDTRTDYFRQKPHQLKAYYQTESEHQAATQPAQTIFNVNNAYSSVIGAGNHIVINYDASITELKQQVENTDSPDKENLDKIVSLLEMVLNNQVPPSKGLFSKFRDVMERNSWFTSAVASTLLSWLMSQIH